MTKLVNLSPRPIVTDSPSLITRLVNLRSLLSALFSCTPTLVAVVMLGSSTALYKTPLTLKTAMTVRPPAKQNCPTARRGHRLEQNKAFTTPRHGHRSKQNEAIGQKKTRPPDKTNGATGQIKTRPPGAGHEYLAGGVASGAVEGEGEENGGGECGRLGRKGGGRE